MPWKNFKLSYQKYYNVRNPMRFHYEELVYTSMI